jgi:choline dehydrogenase-like flavoprotein
MILDARRIPNDSVIDCDVCIVGAGAAGITIAREFLGRPVQVVLLESGWLTPDADTQSLYAGAVTEQPYFDLHAARSRYFGGTTNLWTGECRPLDAQDFELRDWVPDSGWPFGLDELLPYYRKAQSVCQLGPYGYAADDWRGHGVRPMAIEGGRIQSDAFQYSPPTRFGEVYRNEVRQAPHIVTYLGANAVDLETPAPPQQVSAVKVVCLAGTSFRVAARVFVLATGGIENARLLLLADRVQAAGVGNGHDLVGRYFMEHIYLDAAAEIRAPRGAVSDFYTFGHWVDGRRVRGILGLTPEVRRRERLTNYCAVIVEPNSSLLTRLRNAMANVRSRPTPRAYHVKNVMEQAPHSESRVTLGQDRDRLGCRRTVLRWRLSSIDKSTAHRAHAILGEDITRSALGHMTSSMGSEADPWPASVRGARHHMGTTRMHTDPRRGVVDADCRVHGIANLYVAGSSVFPTSGAANPTLTIVALALRLARHLPNRVSPTTPRETP